MDANYEAARRKLAELVDLVEELNQTEVLPAVLVEAVDNLPLVCENGCPEGILGRHKFSCSLARSTHGSWSYVTFWE